MNQLLHREFGAITAFRRFLEVLGRVAAYLAAPIARIALALPFFRSGLTRWAGFFELSPATQFLFAEQFKLHLFGKLYPLPWSDAMAYVTASAEITLPILVIVGLATRLSALALLIMTGVIQLIFPDGWINFHLYWAALALAIIAGGPGPVSVDYWLLRLTSHRGKGTEKMNE
jgi:putative oxidoreductase